MMDGNNGEKVRENVREKNMHNIPATVGKDSAIGGRGGWHFQRSGHLSSKKAF